MSSISTPTTSLSSSSPASARELPQPRNPQQPQEMIWLGLSLSTWLTIAIIAVLMVWVFYVPVLRRLWEKTNPFWGEPNWGHAIVVPIVGLYYLYLNREQLLSVPVKPLLAGGLSRARFVGGAGLLLTSSLGYFACPFILPVTLIPFGEVACMSLAGLAGLVLLLDWGIATLLFGLGVFAWGIWPGQNDWVKDFGMVLTLFGVVLTLCGWQVMRIAWFPIVFLICALPWPGLFYSKIAMPLQQLAASVAVWTLQLTGVDASRVGTKIVMDYGFGRAPRILNVAEACAGMRSLMTFISVGAAVAFLSSRPLWQKLFITASAVPIAIFCNVMRVTGQGLLDYYVSPKLSESFAHQFVGLVMLVPAFFLILLVGWVLDQLFVEEVEEVDPLTVTVTPRRDGGPSHSAAAAEGRSCPH